MKKSIIKMTASFCIIALSVTSCNNSAKTVEKAEEKVLEAKEELQRVNDSYKVEVEEYRKITNDKIMSNNQSIIEFNARIDSQKKEAKADYTKKINELDKKNNDMKKRMEDYRADSKENWQSFKSEFGHDMDELGVAFRDLTVNNIK
jgi:uncharacterized protein YPO0396